MAYRIQGPHAGTYTRLAAESFGGRVAYKHSENSYIYFVPGGQGRWLIGPSPGTNWASVQSTASTAACPHEVSSWIWWSGASWVATGVTVDTGCDHVPPSVPLPALPRPGLLPPPCPPGHPSPRPPTPSPAQRTPSYTLVDTPLTWSAAERECSRMGGALAAIVTAEENAAVRAIVRVSSWIGGSDRDMEGTWEWTGHREPRWELNDGRIPTQATPATASYAHRYSNWLPGEPDNAGEGEDCMVVVTSPSAAVVDGKWADGDCLQRKPFVCEGVDARHLLHAPPALPIASPPPADLFPRARYGFVSHGQCADAGFVRISTAQECGRAFAELGYSQRDDQVEVMPCACACYMCMCMCMGGLFPIPKAAVRI